MKEEENKGFLHCTAFGDLRPADLREECEYCQECGQLADSGGCPGMLLTGSRAALAAALRRPGVVMDDVVVINAKEYREMCEELCVSRFVLDKFSREWYAEDGECPKIQHPDFPCSGEKDHNDDPKERECEFDAGYCAWEYGESTYHCWEELYRWQYQKQFQKKDTDHE